MMFVCQQFGIIYEYTRKGFDVKLKDFGFIYVRKQRFTFTTVNKLKQKFHNLRKVQKKIHFLKTNIF